MPYHRRCARRSQARRLSGLRASALVVVSRRQSAGRCNWLGGTPRMRRKAAAKALGLAYAVGHHYCHHYLLSGFGGFDSRIDGRTG
jgi:hypothetical protein